MRAKKSPELKALEEISNKQVDNMIIPIINMKCEFISSNDRGRVIYMLGNVLQKRVAEHIIDKKALENVMPTVDKYTKLEAHIMADPKKYPDLIPFLN